MNAVSIVGYIPRDPVINRGNFFTIRIKVFIDIVGNIRAGIGF
jgi:hypothetical protein